MNKNIILLTKVFPYSSGEEFLEEEINILASRFNTIVVVATAVPYGARQTRQVPDNVIVYRIKEVPYRYLKYVKYVLKGILSFFKPDLQKELHKKSIKGKVGSIYIFGRCRSIGKKIFKNGTVKKILKEENTVIYSYWFSDLPYIAILLKNRSNNNSIKIISRAHGYDLYEYRNASGSIPFRKTVITKIDGVFPCSKDGQRYLCEHYLGCSDKVKVSYLGTKDLGMGSNDNKGYYHVVTCSAIIPLKRLDLLAHALAIISGKGMDIRWTCIGDGPQLSFLRKIAGDDSQRINANFTGRLKHEEVLRFFKSNTVDLFINVSETEGLPVSIMEAISFGIPCLATDVGGTREIVIPNLTGNLISSEVTPEDLADKIIQSLNHDYNRVLIREYWKNNFCGVYNYEKFAQDIKEL